MENPANPFAPGNKVITKFMGTEVEVPVIQVYNREVQIRTADKVLRWRTCKTVWFPPDKVAVPTAEPVPKSVATSPVGPETAPVNALPPAEINRSESAAPTESELGIISPPSVGQSFVTVCGQEEAEELQRANRKRKRRTNRRRA